MRRIALLVNVVWLVVGIVGINSIIGADPSLSLLYFLMLLTLVLNIVTLWNLGRKPPA